MKAYKITLHDERPMTMNGFYSGRHWAVRKNENDRVHALVAAHLPRDKQGNKITLPFRWTPVDIVCTVYFKGRMQDSGNISTKPYIDALIGELIADDTPEYVHSVTTASYKDNDSPRYEIRISEAAYRSWRGVSDD